MRTSVQADSLYSSTSSQVMHTTYRRLTYYINFLLFVGIIISIFEFFTDEFSEPLEYLFLDLFFCYWIGSSLYFIYHTGHVNSQSRTVDSLDNFEIADKPLERFPFYLGIAITNLIIGFMIISFSIYILFSTFSQTYVDLSEIGRLIAIIIFLGYGVLKIHYTLNIIKRIKKNP